MQKFIVFVVLALQAFYVHADICETQLNSKLPSVSILQMLRGKTEVLLADRGHMMELRTDTLSAKTTASVAGLLAHIKPFAFLREAIALYKKLPPRIVFIGDGLLVRELSKHEDQLSNRPYEVTGLTRSLGAESLMVSEGEAWERIHHVLEPFLMKRGIGERYHALIVEEVEAQLGKSFDGQRLNVEEFGGHVAENVIFHVVTGQALTEAQREILFPRAKKLPRERIAALFAPTGLLDRSLIASGSLAEALAHGAPSESWVLDQLANLISNGEVTTRLVLARAIRELASDPRHQLRFQKDSSYEDRGAFVKEVLRQRTIAPFAVSREALADFQLGPYAIKKGTWLVIHTWSVHENPLDWPVEKNFSPEAISAPKKRKEASGFCPFGFGRRHCVGRHLAFLETETVLEILCQQYSFTPSDFGDVEMVKR